MRARTQAGRKAGSHARTLARTHASEWVIKSESSLQRPHARRENSRVCVTERCASRLFVLFFFLSDGKQRRQQFSLQFRL